MSAVTIPITPTPWTLPDQGKVAMAGLIIAEAAIFTIFVVAYLFYVGKSLTGLHPAQSCSAEHNGFALHRRMQPTHRVVRGRCLSGEVSGRPKRAGKGVSTKSAAGYSRIMPRRAAIVTDCVRSVAPSFAKMCLT